MLNEQDAGESDFKLNHIRRFIFEGLNSYDQSELTSMGMADYFHPDVQWYGPGWSGVKATHTGEYLDCQPTGRAIEFNGLDFWKLENDVYVENWVFVDMIHLFRQLGVDLFARIPGRKV
jgi:hypothetical protein